VLGSTTLRYNSRPAAGRPNGTRPDFDRDRVVEVHFKGRIIVKEPGQ
jgi:hypothetical protein